MKKYLSVQCIEWLFPNCSAFLVTGFLLREILEDLTIPVFFVK